MFGKERRNVIQIVNEVLSICGRFRRHTTDAGEVKQIDSTEQRIRNILSHNATLMSCRHLSAGSRAFLEVTPLLQERQTRQFKRRPSPPLGTTMPYDWKDNILRSIITQTPTMNSLHLRLQLRCPVLKQPLRPSGRICTYEVPGLMFVTAFVRSCAEMPYKLNFAYWLVLRNQNRIRRPYQTKIPPSHSRSILQQYGPMCQFLVFGRIL